MKKQHRWNVWYFLLSFVLLVAVQSWWAQQNAVQTLPYSEFLRQLEEEKLLELKVEHQRRGAALLLEHETLTPEDFPPLRAAAYAA